MIKIDQPVFFNVAKILTECSQSKQKKGLRARILSEVVNLAALEAEYKKRAAARTLYEYAESTETGSLTVAEMSDLYANTLVKKTGPIRYIYNYIKSMAPSAICPLCNHRDISTLDHYLAKAYHPSFSLTPVNLVPACKSCNSDTLARRPKQMAEQTLHPYFDDVDNKDWLVARVMESAPPAIVFEVNPGLDFNDPANAILKSHFEVFNLETLYSSAAANMASSMYADLNRNLTNGGTVFVVSELRRAARNAREPVRNSWQGAMLDAMANSAWFSAGGFKTFKLARRPGPKDEDVAKLSEDELAKKREKLKELYQPPAAPKKAKKKKKTKA